MIQKAQYWQCEVHGDHCVCVCVSGQSDGNQKEENFHLSIVSSFFRSLSISIFQAHDEPPLHKENLNKPHLCLVQDFPLQQESLYCIVITVVSSGAVRNTTLGPKSKW